MRKHKAPQIDLPLPGEAFALVGERVSKQDEELLRVVANADEKIRQAVLRLEVKQAVEDIRPAAPRGWEVIEGGGAKPLVPSSVEAWLAEPVRTIGGAS